MALLELPVHHRCRPAYRSELQGKTGSPHVQLHWRASPVTALGRSESTHFGDRLHTRRSLASLPVEIIRRIVEELPWLEAVRLRAVSRSFASLCASPVFFRALDLGDNELCFLRIPSSIRRHARHVALQNRTASTAHLSLFFGEGDAFVNLVSLDLSFANVNELLFDSFSLKAREQLRHLKMRGCRQLRDGVWLAELLPNLETLDLSWSGVRTLPCGEHKPPAVLHSASMDLDMSSVADLSLSSDDTLVDEEQVSLPWHSLRRLGLAGCGYLQRDSLSAFLGDYLPPALASIDLSWQSPLSLDIAALVQVLPEAVGGERHFAIDLSRADSVTLAHVVGIERNTRIKVCHTAVLEDDSITAYRRFLEMLSSPL